MLGKCILSMELLQQRENVASGHIHTQTIGRRAGRQFSREFTAPGKPITQPPLSTLCVPLLVCHPCQEGF